MTTHACELLADRGVLFVNPGDQVYAGQLCGEHCRDNDLVVNITRMKALDNMRAASKDKTIVLKTPRQVGLKPQLSTSRTMNSSRSLGRSVCGRRSWKRVCVADPSGRPETRKKRRSEPEAQS